MTKFTEQAIQETFIQLLGDQPIDKITVHEIASSCGISRNTFYYHYHDIYDLLEQILATEEQRMLNDMRDVSTMRQCFTESMRFAIKHRQAIIHVYTSSSRDMLTRYLYNFAEISMRRYVENQCTGEMIDERDFNDLVFLLTSMVQGVVINILRDGTSWDVEALIDNAARLLDGTVKVALKNCGKAV